MMKMMMMNNEEKYCLADIAPYYRGNVITGIFNRIFNEKRQASIVFVFAFSFHLERKPSVRVSSKILALVNTLKVCRSSSMNFDSIC